MKKTSKGPKGPKGQRPTWLVGLLTALIASVLIGAVYFPVSWEIRYRSRVKSASCLKQIGLAALMYINSQPAAPAALPTTAPTTGPATQPIGAEALWSRLRAGGYVVLVRHAATPPGSGDPANFDLADRSTQRNLTDAGREQAQRVGEAFRREAVPVGRVLTSQYFRCRDTASLAFGSAEADPALNGLPEDAAAAKAQIEVLRKRVAQKPHGGNTVLVTHQANILALTGIKPDPAECVILTPEGDGAFRVVGRLTADEAHRP